MTRMLVTTKYVLENFKKIIQKIILLFLLFLHRIIRMIMFSLTNIVLPRTSQKLSISFPIFYCLVFFIPWFEFVFCNVILTSSVKKKRLRYRLRDVPENASNVIGHDKYLSKITPTHL